jgi:hypothetical protein|tara:strand:- start:1581 stop:3446 length:1866 start_codon:yes stop_codon:yes gene_type:complete
MADTFLQLTETPSSFNASANKFVRVNNTEDGIQFWNVSLPDLEDVTALGAYAPSTGDVLTYFADNKWKPASPDIYSAGNGLNKVGLGFNVQALAGGSLTSDGTGVYISDIANVAGTYGNASTATTFIVNSKGQITDATEVTIVASQAETITNDFVGTTVGTSGQISVVGGTGNNSTATINLVATGVTAGVYGNTTYAPVITVDGYGRVSNIDTVAITGGGGGGGAVEVSYKTINVSGQSPISADSSEDILTFEAGTGILLTTSAGDDKVTFTADADSIVAQSTLNTLSNLNAASPADGNALVWDAGTSKWVAGTTATVLPVSGVTAGTYGSTGNILAVTVDDKGIVTAVTETAFTQGDIQSVLAGTGLTGGGTSGVVTLDLDQTGVTPGTYGDSGNVTQFTIDSVGRISNVTEVAIAGDILGVVAGTGLTGGGTSGTVTLDLEPSGVTAATYGTATSIPQITVDALGRVTTVTSLDVSDHTQSLSWNAANTTLQIGGGNSVDLSSLADVSTTSIASLSDIDTLSGISNGQALLWNTAESKFKYGNVSGGGASNAYKTITVSGQSNVVATGEDTLTLVAGSGTTITTDAGATSVTITSTPTVGLNFGTFDAPSGGTLDMGAF